METPDQTAAAKTRLRQRIRERRALLTPEQRAAAGQAIAAAGLALAREVGAERVACYLAMGDEPDTAALIDRLTESGVQLLLPIVADGGLEWGVHRPGAEVAVGRFGISEPTGPRVGPAALAGIDLALIPALAVDRAGHRLGRGGGYLDGALRAGRPRFTIAVVYDGEILAEVPSDTGDEDVDGALSPAGVSWLPTAAS